MIPRYSRPEMTAIWEPQTRFRIWFEIEAHAADAMADLGIVPKSAAKKIWAMGKDAIFDVARIDAIEAETKHDVIAFLTHLSEIVGPEARFVHQGMTSSDVLDTCFNIQLVRAADLLIADVDGLLAALKRRALEHKDSICIGRSHGIHAEPTTFGVKLAYSYAEFSRCRARLVAARQEVSTCAISGAVGTFANIDPSVEEYVAGKTGAFAGAGVDPGDPQGPPCHVFLGACGCRQFHRAAGHGNPASAANRSAGSRGIFLARARRVPRRCRTSAIRCSPKISPAWQGWCARRRCRRLKMWPSGMSGTFRIPRWSAASGPMPRCIWILPSSA